jgi:hypothetical protein
MGAKMKSKTHLQSKFLDFLSSFLRVWLPKNAHKTAQKTESLFFIKVS